MHNCEAYALLYERLAASLKLMQLKAAACLRQRLVEALPIAFGDLHMEVEAVRNISWFPGLTFALSGAVSASPRQTDEDRP